MLALSLLLATQLPAIQPPATPPNDDGQPERSRPNVVLMMADDLGWGDVGFHGHRVLRTPHLDAMAAAGVRLDRFYAAAPVCSPTRGSVLTGRHPFRYGITNANVGHLQRREQTLAELLGDLGYATGHFGKWHLGTMSPSESGKRGRNPKKNFLQPHEAGFATWFATEYATPTFAPYQNRSESPWSPYFRSRRVKDGIVGELVASLPAKCDSELIVDEAAKMIRGAVAERRPFLAVIWFHAPHLPIVEHPTFAADYPEVSAEERAYFSTVAAVDEQVGRVRALLRTLGVADRTVVAFASDNGPEGNPGPRGKSQGTAGPFRGRKRSLYEGGLRVPAVIEWSGELPPRVVTVPAVTSDYVPTIAALVGAELERPSDGIDLLPILRGEQIERDAAIGFQTTGNRAAWMTDRFKLHVRDADKPAKRERSDNGSATPERVELYDLLADPGETQNIAERSPAVVAEMQMALEAWRASCASDAAASDAAASVPAASVPAAIAPAARREGKSVTR